MHTYARRNASVMFDLVALCAHVGPAPFYVAAYRLIEADPNQYLMVVTLGTAIVGTCHLTVMPSLTFTGTTRLQIEAVRVAADYRSKRIGQWMIDSAIDYGKSRGANLLQLTTNKQRTKAKQFYERLGFVASHEGMKMQLS